MHSSFIIAMAIAEVATHNFQTISAMEILISLLK